MRGINGTADEGKNPVNSARSPMQSGYGFIESD